MLTSHTPRRADRRPTQRAIILLIEDNHQSIEQPAESTDWSLQGLGLKTTLQLTPGQSVLVIPNEGPQFAVQTRVAWVGEVGGDTEGRAGLEFIQPAPSN